MGCSSVVIFPEIGVGRASARDSIRNNPSFGRGDAPPPLDALRPRRPQLLLRPGRIYASTWRRSRGLVWFPPVYEARLEISL